MEDEIDQKTDVDMRLKMRDLVNSINILVELTHSGLEVGKARTGEPDVCMD
jgi:hypothetical protein